MPLGGQRTLFSEQTPPTLNLEVLDSVTPNFEVQENNTFSFDIRKLTGTYNGAIVRPECSCNGVDFEDVIGFDLTADGLKQNIPVGTKFVRVRVEKINDELCTVKVILQAK